MGLLHRPLLSWDPPHRRLAGYSHGTSMFQQNHFPPVWCWLDGFGSHNTCLPMTGGDARRPTRWAHPRVCFITRRLTMSDRVGIDRHGVMQTCIDRGIPPQQQSHTPCGHTGSKCCSEVRKDSANVTPAQPPHVLPTDQSKPQGFPGYSGVQSTPLQ